MSLWGIVEGVGLPLIVVGGAVAAVCIAASEPPDRFSRPHGWQWGWVGLWLMTVGDAALGDDRSSFERGWKGTAALLVAVAVVVAVWRHHRWRKRVRGARA